MTQPLIKARTLSGFRDFLPAEMMAREALIATARDVYRSYGFSPIDTPALEYSEVLTGKAGEESEKQLYRFTTKGGRDVAMRFDLTVPFARFAAQHIGQIGTPFKRYHIATVWRGERPQRGRYREFMQCDFDTIGTDSHLADIETLLVIHDLFDRLGFERFTIRVNHRQLLNGLLETLGLADQSAGVLRALDKLPKIGPEGVQQELIEGVGANEATADRLLEFAAISGTPREVLAQVESLLGGNDRGLDGVARLRQLFACVATAGVPADRVALDVSIARGLDYYTGTIYETFLDDLPGIGSVCSGGRYDNLAGLFTKQPLPGVGASLGLDRLLAAMEELKRLGASATPADVLVVLFDESRAGDYFRIARQLRADGVATEVYPQARALKKQLQYADRKGFRFALIAGSDEFDQGVWQLKDLASGEQLQVASDGLSSTIRDRLSAENA